MTLWRKQRYYCSNLAGACHYAAADIPFSARQFREFQGLCRGARGDGCGGKLEVGDPKDLRLTWALVSLLVAVSALGVGWVLRAYVFPPPLQHIEFAAAETHTDDNAGLLEVKVLRKSDLQRRIQVDYTSADGSAKAGEDYQPVHDRLIFEPGEGAKTIRITLVPDISLQKEARYFTLRLVNVAGQPLQIIKIAPRAIDRTREMQAEQAVTSASRIAADIGSYMVKRRVLLSLLTARSGTEADAHDYQQQLLEVEDNLSRAREGYAQSLRDLQTYPAPVVIHAMDHLHDDLQNRQFAQQARALQVMKSQFTELSDHRSMDMDRWVQELETIVPRVSPNNPESST